MEVSVYGMRGCVVRRLGDRYLYFFLCYVSGRADRVVITVRELAKRTGLSVGKVMNGLKRLEKAGLVKRSYLPFRLPDGRLAKRLKIYVSKEPKIEVDEKLLFLEGLTPEERAFLICLSALGNKIFMSKREIANEIFCIHENSKSFKEVFKNLQKKNILKRERFCYVISEVPFQSARQDT